MNKLYYEIFCAYIPESDDEFETKIIYKNKLFETKIIYKTQIFETIPPEDFIPTNEIKYNKIKTFKYIKKNG